MVKSPPGNTGDTSPIPDREDSTRRGATKPVQHSCWSRAPRALAPHREGATIRSLHTAAREQSPLPRLQKRPCSREDPAEPKIKRENHIKIKYQRSTKLHLTNLCFHLHLHIAFMYFLPVSLCKCRQVTDLLTWAMACYLHFLHIAFFPVNNTRWK